MAGFNQLALANPAPLLLEVNTSHSLWFIGRVLDTLCNIQTASAAWFSFSFKHIP